VTTVSITEGVLFESVALGAHAWVVRSLQGYDALNQDYRFELHLELPSATFADEDLERMLSATAAITFVERGVELNRFSGVVLEATAHTDIGHARTDVYVHLAPRAALADLRRGSQLFLDRTPPEVVADKLSQLGLELDADFSFLFRGKYCRREFIAQYEETDLAFVRRICETYGIISSYEERDGRETLIFTDSTDDFSKTTRGTLPNRNRADHPAVYDLRTTVRRVPRDVVVHDYNYRSPRLPLVEREAIRRLGSEGEWAEFGAQARSLDEARDLALIRAEAHEKQGRTLTGHATDASLRAGRRFGITNAIGEETQLIATRVDYRFRLSTKEGDPSKDVGWENRFAAIPVGTPWRPDRVTPVPRVPGLVNATVDGAIRGEYAELDEVGRYHVRLAFDRSGRSDLGATHPMRMMQPHAGASYGMHFPLRPGAEVLVGFVNGDPDRPIIVGAAPNPITTSPVALANQTQNVLRSGGNNELVMEDLAGTERIRIHTPHRDTTVQLGAPEEPEEGVLVTTEAHVTAASRLSNNTVTDRHTLAARSTTGLLGERAVWVAGLASVSTAADAAIERQGALQSAKIRADLGRLGETPRTLLTSTEGASGGAGSSGHGFEPVAVLPEVELRSMNSERLSELVQATAVGIVRMLSESTDKMSDNALGRLQGETLGTPGDPSAILASQRTAALVGREVGLVSGDRIAALSSQSTAAVVGGDHAALKSPVDVEIAAGERLMASSAGEMDVAANTVRLVAGFYPEAEAPPLDDRVSLGVLAKKDILVKSVEDCILLCANKNLVASSHCGDIRLEAAQTVSISGPTIQATGDTVVFDGSKEFRIGGTTVNY